MTTAEIVANLLEGWGVDEWPGLSDIPKLTAMILSRPELLIEIADRFAEPADQELVEALAFHIIDQRLVP